MKRLRSRFISVCKLGTTSSVLALVLAMPAWAELPYARQGWTSQEAAAHLLSRLTFGATPGQVDAVAKMGLEVWLDQQLADQFSNQALKSRLALLPPAYRETNEEIVASYPLPAQLMKKAREEGQAQGMTRQEVMREAREDGARPIKELGSTLFAQKLYHTRYTESQVREVMTEFWFNHFSVALQNNRARRFLLSYERDALRPSALGDFRSLLENTAKHPAMLWYLDNATSTAASSATVLGSGPARMVKRRKGLNENYARELLELHTLGVDGGYSQKDVTETARVLTGWTVVPYGRSPEMKQLTNRGAALGMVREGDFMFAGPLHDAGSKLVLGAAYPQGGGLEEGERLLDQLASHPSTARHVAQKLAVRFVSDQPSEALVDELASVFLQSRGDSKAMLRALVRSDEFWRKSQRGSKVKSPLELLVSAARVLDADLQPTPAIYGWLVDMGQPLYNYQAPTGFPDRAESWVSSGTVLARMNFALEAARGGVLGFSYQVPEVEGLESVVRRLLPYHNPAPVLSKLQPMTGSVAMTFEKVGKPDMKGNLGGRLPGVEFTAMRVAPERRSAASMIGLVLGSPEFQRR